MRRAVSIVIAAATLVLMSSTGGLSNDNERSLTVASHGDPFTSCLVTGANALTSIAANFPDTELEPWVASNPANRRNLIGSYQQDRWTDGGAKGLVAAYSLNSGQSWMSVPLPFSECAAPFYGGNVLHYERASDPWDSIGKDGIAYAVSLSFSNNGDNAVGAARSTDGGRTWTNQQAIIADSGADARLPFNDKESVTADPTAPGTAYAVWDRSFLAPCSAGARAQGSGQRPQTRITKERPAGTAGQNHAGTAAAAPAAAAPLCFVEPTYFSKTTDGGVHWSPPQVIVPTAPGEATISNQIVVNHQTGALYNFFTFFDSQGGISVELVISVDRGTTWSSRQLVSSEDVVGVSDPRNTFLAVRSGIIVSPAIDPRSGQLYITWEASFNGSRNDQAVISTSRSGFTRTWSPPSLISPPGDPGAFLPSIDVNQLGQVGATFYDFRNLKPNTPASILPTDSWFRRTDGPGVSFGHEEHLGRFNMLMAPVAGGFFVGDYEGLVAQQDNSFLAFFSQSDCADVSCPASGNGIGAPTHTPDPQDIFVTTIGGGGGQN
jgi:hypothetical protein